MTSPSLKRRPTTPPSTSAKAPEAARCFAARDALAPMWLPAGWLAAVLMLTAAATSFGAEPTSDGWRARRPSTARPARVKHFAPIRRTAYEDDIVGPALRVASRPSANGSYRVAQQADDPLTDSFRRPFGVEEEQPADAFDPPAEYEPTPAIEPDVRAADDLFDDDLPPLPANESDYDRQVPEERAPAADSLFDETPSDAEDLPAPADPLDDEPYDLADEFARPLDPTPLSGDASESAIAASNCAQDLAELKASRIDTIDLRIAIPGQEGQDYPFSCSLDDGSIFAPRCWGEVTYMWKASGLCHKPLYFEDVHLERYGHSWGPYLQPLVSGAHFFGRLPILPYMMGLKMPNECVYTLGHYRPGDCAPYLLDPVPFTWRAALMQAGGTVGVAAILP